MKQSTKLLSLVLAIVMAFSFMTVIGNAADSITTAENMTSANSRIRDTDMAKEMMNYTKMNVLTQAAQAMLAQANQQPQSVLQLLQ